MTKMKKCLLVIFGVISSLIAMADDCANWNVGITQSSLSLCSSQTLGLDVYARHDSLELTSCECEWYIKLPSSNAYMLFSQNASTSYAFNDVGDYYVFAKVSPNNCVAINTDTIVIVRYKTFVAGEIQGSSTICYGFSATPIVMSVASSGGDGTYSYQWQYKSSGDWTDIPNATTTTYNPGVLYETTSYRLRVTNACASDLTNEVVITVRPQLTAPVVSDYAEIICYGASPSKLSVQTPAIGGLDDSFVYQWQESYDGVSYTDIQGAIGIEYQPASITSARWYRVVATSQLGCGSIISSNFTKVSVYSNLSISTIGTSPLCYMTSGNISVSAIGAGDVFSYQWQESSNGTVFTSINNATNNVYTIEEKVAGTYYYRCIVIPLNGCNKDTSDVISVSVYDGLHAGEIQGSSTICYGSSANSIIMTVASSGGDGTYSYQWQYKSSGDWTDIPNATTTTYNPGVLYETTSYRLRVTNACASDLTNEVVITVRPQLTAPVVSDYAEIICYGASPSKLSVQTPAIGGLDDSFVYQWQESYDGVSYTDIQGAIGIEYQPASITSARWYRVVATSQLGCGSIISSNYTKVLVYPDLKITTTGTSPLCYMTCGKISVSATGEGENYAYQWQESSDNITFTSINNATSNEYITEAKIGGTYYYRCIVVPLNGCTKDTSDVIAVLVYDDLHAGSITGNDTICYGFIAESISVSNLPSGGDGSFSYQWMQKSEGASAFTYIAGTLSTIPKSYSPGVLYKTTQYKLEISNACGVVYTDPVCVYVRNQLVAPLISSSSDTICYNTAPAALEMTGVALGGDDDSFIYQWEESVDGNIFVSISGKTSNTYQPGFLTKKHYYRLCATSVQGCGCVYSNIVEINVFDDMEIITSPTMNLCYMDVAEVSVSVTGGGDEYRYQWQKSADNITYQNISCVASKYTSLPLEGGVYYYRCVVTANKCGTYSKVSDPIRVNVYTDIQVGELGYSHEVCYGENANSLVMITPTTGSILDNVRYSWFVLYDGESEWYKIAQTQQDTYTPERLTKSGQYRLQLITICDTVYTNSVYIKVNSLPDMQEIIGTMKVCYNQYETYTIDVKNGFSYDWQLKNNHGTITVESDDMSSVEILWEDANVSDSILVTITNMTTGCVRKIGELVNICNEAAPNRTIVVRKPNSNILVAQEDGDLFYQWGYTNKNSQEEIYIKDSNRRYVQLPHTFDNQTNDYWLVLRNNVESSCYSKSLYIEGNDALISNSSSYVTVPSLIREEIPIVVHNDENDLVVCCIYTADGMLIARYDLGVEQLIDTQMPFVAPRGMYIMNVQIGNIVETFKLIAE